MPQPNKQAEKSERDQQQNQLFRISKQESKKKNGSKTQKNIEIMTQFYVVKDYEFRFMFVAQKKNKL